MPSWPPAEGCLAAHPHGPLRPAPCSVSTDLPQSPWQPLSQGCGVSAQRVGSWRAFPHHTEGWIYRSLSSVLVRAVP